MLGRDARLCPLTPADCCLSKCQYSLQKTDLRQSELGLLRGEEHSGLHRPGGDGADVGSQVRDRARPIDMEMPGYQSSDQQLAPVPSSQKNTEKSGEIKFLPRIIVKAAAVEFRKFEFRFKYFDQIAKSFKVKYSNLFRSVSCNSSMSKCNKTEDEEEYGPQPGEGRGEDRGAPLMDSMFSKQPGGECPPPPPPPNGNLSCSNPDLVQVTFNKLGYTDECRPGGQS